MHALKFSGILVLLLISLTAAENQSLEELFASGDAAITPPSVEEALAGEMAVGKGSDRRPAMALPIAGAEEEKTETGGLVPLILNLRDITNYQPITNAHIRLYLDNGQQRVATLRFVGENGRMVIQLPPATWNIILKLDLMDTPGKDYYSQFETILSSSQNLTAFLQPVGSLRGDVIDREGNLIIGAQIKFECSGDYGETQPTVTDQFGSFSAEWLPVGMCRVSALSKKAGFSVVNISQGQISHLTITLKQGLSGPEADYSWPVLILVAVIALLTGLILSKMIAKKSQVEEVRVIEPNGRMRDIISALDENERRVIEFLMQKGGKSQQNHIGRELEFPKSSLSRIISGLEVRNLIKTEKIGRIKRVELSDWFLNGKTP